MSLLLKSDCPSSILWHSIVGSMLSLIRGYAALDNTKRKHNNVDTVDRKGKKAMSSLNVNLNKNAMLGKWDDFLEHRDSFHPYSPEYHRVIRSGNGLSSKSYADTALCAKHMSDHENVECIILSASIQQIMVQDSLKEYRKSDRRIVVDDTEEEAHLFLEGIFQGLYNLHTTKEVITDGETTFNSLLLFPFLRSVARAVSNEVDTVKTDICDGEVPLESMTTQLKKLNLMVDDRNIYKADGLIRMFGCSKHEILLLETSNHFGSNDQRKSSFDHCKGSLAILKTITDDFQFGSLATFKLLFLHASENLWSMSLAPEETWYELWLEDTLTHLE